MDIGTPLVDPTSNFACAADGEDLGRVDLNAGDMGGNAVKGTPANLGFVVVGDADPGSSNTLTGVNRW